MKYYWHQIFILQRSKEWHHSYFNSIILKDNFRQEVISLRQMNLYGSNFHMNCKIKEEALCLEPMR